MSWKRPTVLRSLNILCDAGYLRRHSGASSGSVNKYTLLEKIRINDPGTGATEAVVTWDYLPNSVRQAVGEIKNVILHGDWKGVNIIHIDRVYLNINNFAPGQTDGGRAA